MRSLSLASLVAAAAGHGHLTVPPSTRQGGSLATGGSCRNGQCLWFSNNVEIPGKDTLPRHQRSVNENVTGTADVFKTSPWRAPGTAPVYGSGCGSAGGGPVRFANGGNAPKGVEQGLDGLRMPKVGSSTVWTRGSEAEVAWAISANHAGGYSYRLCKNAGNVTEECFARGALRFAGNTSWIVDADGRRDPFQMTKVTEGVYPAGSEWARDPIPECVECDAYTKCGAPLAPVPSNQPGGKHSDAWETQVDCYGECTGSVSSKTSGSCPGATQFPAPLPGISGFGKIIWGWSVMDKVAVPADLEAGEYLLSWRWDCEQSAQVWQNCADITVV